MFLKFSVPFAPQTLRLFSGLKFESQHLATRPELPCSFCWFKTHFSFLMLENGSAKPPAVRLLQNAGCEVHCLGQIPHQIIPLRRWFQLGIVIFASCLILQHRATEQLLISSSPGLAVCHRGPATSPPCSLPCSQTLYGKAANDGKCFEFLSWNLCLLLRLFLLLWSKVVFLKLFCYFCRSVIHFHGYECGNKVARSCQFQPLTDCPVSSEKLLKSLVFYTWK